MPSLIVPPSCAEAFGAMSVAADSAPRAAPNMRLLVMSFSLPCFMQMPFSQAFGSGG
jgi:hypothetical protein